MMRVFHVGHRHSGVGHTVVDHGVDGDGHRVTRENLGYIIRLQNCLLNVASNGYFVSCHLFFGLVCMHYNTV